MRYRTRRRLSLLILLVGLPVYIILAVWLVSLLDRPPLWAEFVLYVALGLVWAFPLKAVFRGVGQAEPDAAPGRDGEG
ncbi:DUF2842 domain-containing protein [Poseidonocella sedimentorum]|uniref:DUF2842 domain-containing protein n=1 Tax=Poseidonocella sedimentorum TaxID=871652 RepID=A0A1I6CXM4_9RHOB|nr:DUF2842 domain-containing protein [Poseidonocella sedimentorum]SFQ97968.1 Protein of unknown function [Poseidonocella sedimentorum]